MISKTGVFIITLILFIIYSVAVWETSKRFIEVKTIRDTDTVEAEIPIPDSTGYEPRIEYVKQKVNIDSLFEVAKKYWQDRVKPDTVERPMVFVAHLDSTYEDDLLRADINLVSRIPIDPEAYYKLKFDVKKEIVFVPTYVQDESFWHNRFGFFAGIGGVYTQAGVADLGLFVGFGVRLN